MSPTDRTKKTGLTLADPAIMKFQLSVPILVYPDSQGTQIRGRLESDPRSMLSSSVCPKQMSQGIPRLVEGDLNLLGAQF